MATELATVVSDYDAKLNEAWEHMHSLEDDFKKLTGRTFGRPRGGTGPPFRSRGAFTSFHRRPVHPPAEEGQYGPMEQRGNEWNDSRRSRFPMSTRGGFRSRPSWNSRSEEYVEYPPPLGKRRLEEAELPYGPAPPSPDERHYQRESSWKEVPEPNYEWRDDWARSRTTIGPRPRRMDYEEPTRRGFRSSRNEERTMGDYGREEFKYGPRRSNRPLVEEARRPYRRRDSPAHAISNQEEKTEQDEPSAKVQRRSKISPITFSEASPPRDSSPSGVRSRVSPIHRNERDAANAVARSREPKGALERNRRFFGMMMNTLRTFDSDGPEGFEAQAQKIKEVGARLEAEREAERKRVAEEKQRIIEQRRQQRLEIRRLQRKRGIVMVHEAEICHMKRLQSFIVTVAEPHICYLPAKHTIRTMELHKKSQRVLEESIAKVREDMNAQLKEIDAMENVEVEEAEAEEEEAHSPENENDFIDENQNVIEHIEVSEQFKNEVPAEGEAELLGESEKYEGDVLATSVTEESMTATRGYESDASSEAEMEADKNATSSVDQTEAANKFDRSEVEMGDTENGGRRGAHS